MLASAELWGDDGKAVLCSQFSEERRAVRGTLRKSPIVGRFFEKQKQYSVLVTQYSVNQNKGCGYLWSDGACSGVQAIPALTAIFASIYKGLRWFQAPGALLSNNPLRRQLTAAAGKQRGYCSAGNHFFCGAGCNPACLRLQMMNGFPHHPNRMEGEPFWIAGHQIQCKAGCKFFWRHHGGLNQALALSTALALKGAGNEIHSRMALISSAASTASARRSIFF